MVGKQFARTGEILVYQTEEDKTRVECRFEQETMWLSQALIGELFQVSVPTVNEHLRNIFDEAELISAANYSEIPNSSPRRTTRCYAFLEKEGELIKAFEEYLRKR